MKVKTSQRQVVLHHLKEHGAISAVEALIYYGVKRLASRICELRQMGWDIKGERKYDNTIKYTLKGV